MQELAAQTVLCRLVVHNHLIEIGEPTGGPLAVGLYEWHNRGGKERAGEGRERRREGWRGGGEGKGEKRGSGGEGAVKRDEGTYVHGN